jgi:hypothetical protein
MRTLSVLAVLALSLAVARAGTADNPSKAKVRQGKALLAKLKLVDGAGSGLDADTVRGVSPIVVVDSKGNFVGAVLRIDPALGGAATVVRRIGTVAVQFVVTAAGIGVASDPNIVDPFLAYYESTDCSGTPLGPVESGFLPRTATAWGTIVYFTSDTPAAIRTVRAERRILVGGSCGGCRSQTVRAVASRIRLRSPVPIRRPRRSTRVRSASFLRFTWTSSLRDPPSLHAALTAVREVSRTGACSATSSPRVRHAGQVQGPRATHST